MKGTIRFVVGFFLVFGAVGGIEQSMTDAGLYGGIALAVAGLVVMASGAKALKSR